MKIISVKLAHACTYSLLLFCFSCPVWLTPSSVSSLPFVSVEGIYVTSQTPHKSVHTTKAVFRPLSLKSPRSVKVFLFAAHMIPPKTGSTSIVKLHRLALDISVGPPWLKMAISPAGPLSPWSSVHMKVWFFSSSAKMFPPPSPHYLLTSPWFYHCGGGTSVWGRQCPPRLWGRSPPHPWTMQLRGGEDSCFPRRKSGIVSPREGGVDARRGNPKGLPTLSLLLMQREHRIWRLFSK